MYTIRHRDEALFLLKDASLSDVSRMTGISRSTLRAWRDHPSKRRRCPRCDGASLPAIHYAALLGYYLGDGCVSAQARYFSLRISCDAAYPRIIDDVVATVDRVNPAGSVHLVTAPGVTVVSANWKHWPCLFPQHGPGRKHERPIVLEDELIGLKS